MPTGYTAGIMDGSTQSFGDFARLCARAFGATIHMRDESLSAPYVPRVPSDYHKKELAVERKRLKRLRATSDASILRRYKKQHLDNINYHKKRIDAKNLDAQQLNAFLEQARAYKPPTPDHQGIKNFMIEQIESTLDWDCNIKYDEEAVQKSQLLLLNLNAEEIRQKLITDTLKNIDYHKKHHKEDMENCKSANKWVKQYYKSIEKLK